MDSLSQLALGAAVGAAVMGRRTAVWKAALWGGIAGTLPDLDAFIDHGDAVANMTLHRAHSHGLFWLTLGAPLLAWLASRVHGGGQFRRWWLALWLALVTHPLLDTMTVYGTQLLQPFSGHPYGVGSMFIIDPLYTLALLIGLGWALARGAPGLRANAWGLALSTAYLGWSMLAQWHVQGVVHRQLAAQGTPVASERVLVTPSPFNTVLWRIVILREGGYDEGFHSLLDGARPVRLDRFATDPALEAALADLPAVRRMRAFTHGFYRLHEREGTAYLTDLRMGQEPNYVFSFAVARRASDWQPLRPENRGERGNVREGLAWLGPRILGRDVAPPR